MKKKVLYGQEKKNNGEYLTAGEKGNDDGKSDGKGDEDERERRRTNVLNTRSVKNNARITAKSFRTKHRLREEGFMNAVRRKLVENGCSPAGSRDEGSSISKATNKGCLESW
ncbi:hypothetical protein PoB_002789000 [Plakobranchus ocellatus]|uniref:Uncharacterized protein n=1 Tax=Plakobranchus ocellatus TaxID=259542 RepID=A0AAV4A1T7_9GAST|nr:hypothetical protein PoB_002789000 [Plakobranchus ocellatus]